MKELLQSQIALRWGADRSLPSGRDLGGAHELTLLTTVMKGFTAASSVPAFSLILALYVRARKKKISRDTGRRLAQDSHTQRAEASTGK